MRKPARITLTVAAAVAMAGCGRRPQDPCDAATFDQQVCQDAVGRGGYYWDGGWYPMHYYSQYPYYYDRYHSYVSRGGAVVAAPAGVYANPSVLRGGFGAMGAAHGAAGEAGGE